MTRSALIEAMAFAMFSAFIEGLNAQWRWDNRVPEGAKSRWRQEAAVALGVVETLTGLLGEMVEPEQMEMSA